ncbi:MAG: hypothetical protein LBR44_10805 [Clostridiales Family XIII bacterium]|jgi:hypothetical protein|nr:hypothetical protein [Clostridiales Family XIII bacterium]
MGLFAPAWENKNEEKALRAVGKITDQQQLASIAKTAPNFNVRAAAAGKITDQLLLADIVTSLNHGTILEMNPKDDRASYDAVKKHVMVIHAALDALTDKRLIEEIALSNLSKPVIEKALEKVTDVAVLEKVIVKHPYFATVGYVEQFQHIETLKTIARYAALTPTAQNSQILASTLPRIQDEMWVAELFCLCGGRGLADILSGYIKSDAALEYVAQNAKPKSRY